MIYAIGFSSFVLVLAYVFLVRPVLVHAPILSRAFKAEAAYIDQLRAKLAGFKTRLTARAVMLAGVLVEIHDGVMPLIAGQDWTPVTSRLPAWAIPIGLVAIGYVFNLLRMVTERPPQVVMQKIDGVPQVVALDKPAG